MSDQIKFKQGAGKAFKDAGAGMRWVIGALVVLVVLTGAGCSGSSPLPTATPSATIEPTRTATNTRAPTNTPTTDPVYTSMVEQVNKLYEDGYLPTADGSFHRMDDYHTSEALNLYIFSYPRDEEPTDFVLTGDLQWSISTNTANTFLSGCGFVFRYQDGDNFYGTYLDMDGYAQVFRWVGHPDYLNYGYYGKVSMHEGTATMTITMVEHIMTIFVNEKKLVQIHDERLEWGNLGFLLASGTNQEPGTTCDWTNVAYWELP